MSKIKMKYIRSFESFDFELTKIDTGELKAGTEDTIDAKQTMYSPEWERLLPKEFSILYHDETYTFKKGNIMLVGDLVEISYDAKEEIWGAPNTLEFDLYFVRNVNTNKMRVTVDITFGDLMACEFSVEEPNIVSVIEYTSYGSKFDPSNTVFALTDKSLKDFVKFLNQLNEFKLEVDQFKFLDKYNNYNPNN